MFSERLDEALDERKATAVAHAIGVSDSRLSSYRRGRRMPRLDTFRDLADELGVSADWLLGLSDAQEQTPLDLDRVREEAAEYTADRALELFERRLEHAVQVLPRDLRQRFITRLTHHEKELEAEDAPPTRRRAG